MALTARLDKLLTFDRADFQLTRLALVLGALAVALTAVVRPLWLWTRGDPLQGVFTVDPTIASQLSTQPDVDVEWTGEVVATLPTPSTVDRLADLAPGIALSIAVLLLAWLGLRLLTAISSAEPFTPRTVWALRGIAGTLLAAMLVLPAANGWREAMFATSALTEPADATLLLEPLWALGLGTVTLVIASMAEAFARGARLEQDTEGLV